MIHEIYPSASVEPELIVPDSMRGKTWERATPFAKWFADEWKFADRSPLASCQMY